MSREDSKNATPNQAPEPHAEVPRSGAGAGTALSAMLKKRQMRATRDTEPDVQPATTKAGTGSNE